MNYFTKSCLTFPTDNELEIIRHQGFGYRGHISNVSFVKSKHGFYYSGSLFYSKVVKITHRGDVGIKSMHFRSDMLEKNKV